MPLRGWRAPAQVAPQLQVIAIADAPLQVPHASTTAYELKPLSMANACQMLRLRAPEVRSGLVLLIRIVQPHDYRQIL